MAESKVFVVAVKFTMALKKNVTMLLRSFKNRKEFFLSGGIIALSGVELP
jgi:hypothetical protein